MIKYALHYLVSLLAQPFLFENPLGGVEEMGDSYLILVSRGWSTI